MDDDDMPDLFVVTAFATAFESMERSVTVIATTIRVSPTAIEVPRGGSSAC